MDVFEQNWYENFSDLYLFLFMTASSKASGGEDTRALLAAHKQIECIIPQFCVSSRIRATPFYLIPALSDTINNAHHMVDCIFYFRSRLLFPKPKNLSYWKLSSKWHHAGPKLDLRRRNREFNFALSFKVIVKDYTRRVFQRSVVCIFDSSKAWRLVNMTVNQNTARNEFSAR